MNRNASLREKCEAVIKTALEKGFLTSISDADLDPVITVATDFGDQRTHNNIKAGLVSYEYASTCAKVYKWDYDKLAASIPNIRQLTIEESQRGF